ncbi:MAG TPA: hypothetical protein VF950_26435 [Planctomycetota bacterium]
MRFREAAGRRGLVAVLLAGILLPACGTTEERPIRSVATAATAEEIGGILEEISDRADAAACLERGRAYERLRALKVGEPGALLRRGDEADLAVLALPASREAKAEAAGRLARHFRERARTPALSRSTFSGPAADLLRTFVFDTISAYFGEVASAVEHAAALERMAATAQELADHASLRPEGRDRWHARARLYALRAVERVSGDAPPDPAPEALKFCEVDLARRLEEATRCADYGTREKASRGDPERALEWYLLSLCHFGVAREVLERPSPAQDHAMAARDVVVRCLSELLCRE